MTGNKHMDKLVCGGTVMNVIWTDINIFMHYLLSMNWFLNWQLGYLLGINYGNGEELTFVRLKYVFFYT